MLWHNILNIRNSKYYTDLKTLTLLTFIIYILQWSSKKYETRLTEIE